MDFIKMEEEGDSSLPCVICGDDVPRRPVEDDIVIVTRKLKDDPIFQCFLKLFKVKDFEGNDEPDSIYKFCGSCKLHLGNLLDLQIKLDQLKKQITSGVEQLKGKMETNEGTFESDEIYENYPRYRTLRDKIVKDSTENSSSSTKAKPKRTKTSVTVTNQQKLALETILQHGHQLPWAPSSSSAPPAPDSSKPRMYLKLFEYPDKQLVLCGDFTFNLLEGAKEGEGDVKCTICDVNMPYTKTAIKGHVIKVHTDNYVCPHCSLKFARGGDLQSHILNIHESQSHKKRKTIECKICQRPISSAQRKGHEWSHKSKAEKEEALKDPTTSQIPKSFLNEKRFKCDQCEDYSFPSLALLKRHQNRRHRDVSERMELCPDCGGSYLNLRAHIRAQHPKEEEGVVDLMKTCLEPGCGKRFGNLGDLTRHKNQVHKKLKPFECPDCGKCFGGKWNYTQHMKSHEVKVQVKVEVGE